MPFFNLLLFLCKSEMVEVTADYIAMLAAGGFIASGATRLFSDNLSQTYEIGIEGTAYEVWYDLRFDEQGHVCRMKCSLDALYDDTPMSVVGSMQSAHERAMNIINTFLDGAGIIYK